MLTIPTLFQNQDFVVVDKPNNISVHNNEDPQNLLLWAQKKFATPHLYPVHRLDKETSGIQILALNSVAAKKLAEEFQNRSVLKIYSGVLRGQLKETQGVWSQALSDKSEGRKNPAGSSKDRVPCETRFTVLRSSKYFSLCEFNLITGRQHQIRKHAALANHALVGDPRYADPKYNHKIAGLYKTDRMFLHCGKIEILGQTFVSPVPEIFITLLQENN